MKLLIRAAILPWLIFTIASASAFDFSRTIEFPSSEQEEFLSIHLDSALYDHTRNGFPDIRLIDAARVETPFLIDKLRSQRSKSVRRHQDARIVSLQQSENGAIEILLRLNDDAPPAEGLSLNTPLVNFEHRVRVFGSADGKSWHSLLEDGLIYDYSRFIDLSNREIALPANPYRWLKVRVEEPVQSYESENLELTREWQHGQQQGHRESLNIRRVPLRIDRIGYWYSEVQARPAVDTLLDYPVAGFNVVQDEDKKRTLIEITTRREPLTAFIIQSDQRNFSRRAIVEIPDTAQGIRSGWRQIGEAKLQRISFRALHREHLRVAFPEHREQQYRIVIQNDNNPPLEVGGVRARGKAYRLLFFAEPGKTYGLEYGDDSAPAPVYDTASLEAALAASYEPARVEAGAENPAPKGAGGRQFDFTRWLNSDLFLGGVVFLVVVILAAALVNAGKRIDRGSGD
ncbi:MAG: DUF3999 family protein [Gammaproteobacteria bacterium]